MKKLLLFITLISLCISLAGCNNVKAGELSFDNSSESVILCNPDNISKAAAQAFGSDEKSLKASMEENNIILSGAAKDKTYTFNVVKISTEFSNKIIDLRNFTESQLDDIAVSLVSDYNTYFKSEEATYICIDGYTESAVKKPLCNRQYITVKNGDMYIITIITDDEIIDSDDEKTMSDIIENISIKSPKEYNVLYIVLVGAVILVLVGAVAVITVSIIKDIKKNSTDNK